MTLQFQKYTDNGSDTSYKLTRCSPLVSFIFFDILDCTDIYQELVAVNQYNKSDYIPNAIKIISHPFIFNVNKTITMKLGAMIKWQEIQYLTQIVRLN